MENNRIPVAKVEMQLPEMRDKITVLMRDYVDELTPIMQKEARTLAEQAFIDFKPEVQKMATEVIASHFQTIIWELMSEESVQDMLRKQAKTIVERVIKSWS